MEGALCWEPAGLGQTLILATCEAGIWTDYPKPSESYYPWQVGSPGLLCWSMSPVPVLVPCREPTRTQNIVVCAGNPGSSLGPEASGPGAGPYFPYLFSPPGLPAPWPGQCMDTKMQLLLQKQEPKSLCKEKGLQAAALWVWRKGEDGGLQKRKFPHSIFRLCIK